MQFDPDSAAVIVVDMQNGFCHPDGSLYAPPSEAAIDPVGDLIARASDAGAAVVYTRDVHPPEQFDEAHYYDEFDRWGEHVTEGSWDAEIVDELPSDDAAHVVEKHTYDAFHETELDGWLSARGYDDLLLCGTLANVCVLHTAGSAGLRDYRPVVVEDALGFIEEDHREYAVDHADWLFGETTTLDAVSFEVEWCRSSRSAKSTHPTESRGSARGTHPGRFATPGRRRPCRWRSTRRSCRPR
jgi:nicotinamidase-related amidase